MNQLLTKHNKEIGKKFQEKFGNRFKGSTFLEVWQFEVWQFIEIQNKELAITLRNYWSERVDKEVNQAIDNCNINIERKYKKQKQEVRARVEEMRPYPFRPCPFCGGKLKFGSNDVPQSDTYRERWGCYNENCPKVKKHNYFNINVPIREAEKINQALQDLIKALK